jgi:hypothetical protein
MRAYEYPISDRNAMVYRNIILDFYIISYINSEIDVHTLGKNAICANNGILPDLAPVPYFGTFADLGCR